MYWLKRVGVVKEGIRKGNLLGFLFFVVCPAKQANPSR
jgi:hypothetical protein